jgi:hypothetical protein
LKKQALLAAFPYTLPVMTGYLFIGIAFGVLLTSKGFSPWWALAMSLFIYAGAMQFVTIALISGPFAPLTAALMTLMVNARHLFYGLSMLTRFRPYGKDKAYPVFALTDALDQMFMIADHRVGSFSEAEIDDPLCILRGLFVELSPAVKTHHYIIGSLFAPCDITDHVFKLLFVRFLPLLNRDCQKARCSKPESEADAFCRNGSGS